MNNFDRYAHIIGWGTSVPKKVVSNQELSEMVDTTDEWIESRTGIKQRYIADNTETTASLGLKASKNALDVANISPKDLDLIIVATCTPEHNFPSTASIIQDKLGATRAGAFDMNAACTGFVYALSVANQMIRSGAFNTILIVGSETLSKIVNWEDRSTCVLFGDGAGAIVLQEKNQPGGILTSVLRSDGSGADLLKVPAGGSAMPATNHTVENNLHAITMNGREVFRFATRVMADACNKVVQQADMTLDDIDFIIPHQANKRIIETAARNLNLPLDKFIMNLDTHGNTSAASIPLALCEAISNQQIKDKHNIIFVAFGGGLSWGATLVSWDMTHTKPVNQIWHKLRRQALYGFAKIRSTIRRSTRKIEGILLKDDSTDIDKT
tara:strand:- start:66 stop:1214 length:1149 start_codon:yes stop_codon:yes gene_type:complete